VLFIGSPLHSDLGPGDAGGGLYGLVMMGLAQQVGMPVALGGAQSISDALVRMILSLGGQILTNQRVDRVMMRNNRVVGVEAAGVEIRTRRAVLATLPPTLLFGRLIEPDLLPASFMRAVKGFRWGSGVFKLDLALGSMPRFNAESLNGAGVLHLGRTSLALTAAVHQVKDQLLPAAPPLIAGLHTLADPTRAPVGCHTLWIETHVPSQPLGDAAEHLTDCDWDSLREPFAERLIDELSVFAPDLRSRILDYHAQTPGDLEAANANLVGGDIAGGSYTIDQQLVFRPIAGWFRHAMPIKGLYLGGASAHPGGGVHGGAGANAARVLLQDLKLKSLDESVRNGLRQLRGWVMP
jgi:phytoene dehydrogenase-like protein